MCELGLSTRTMEVWERPTSQKLFALAHARLYYNSVRRFGCSACASGVKRSRCRVSTWHSWPALLESAMLAKAHLGRCSPMLSSNRSERQIQPSLGAKECRAVEPNPKERSHAPQCAPRTAQEAMAGCRDSPAPESPTETVGRSPPAPERFRVSVGSTRLPHFRRRRRQPKRPAVCPAIASTALCLTPRLSQQSLKC